MSKRRGTRSADDSGDTYDRATQVIDSIEFRVDTSKQIATLELDASSSRRWLMIIVALLVLNWLHDLGASAEMLDWWDGREGSGGLLSTELEHEITVLMPLLLAVIPIVWGRLRDRKAKREFEEEKK